MAVKNKNITINIKIYFITLEQVEKYKYMGSLYEGTETRKTKINTGIL